MAHIDHVLIPVVDLTAAAEAFAERSGLRSAVGGRHPGHGTANRIVPLGGAYLEFISVVDPDEAAASPFGRWVARHAPAGRPAGLCIAEPVRSVVDRLGLEPIRMARRLPYGGELSWRLMGLADALTREVPFFIEWEVPPDRHPGRMPVSHETVPRGLAVELRGDVDELTTWVGEVPGITLVAGAPGVGRVVVETDAGPLEL